MKRSDMVAGIREIIEDFLEDHMPSFVAENVLTFIEDKGMLPPDYNVNEGSGKFQIPSSYVHEWEPEDEKK